MIALTKDLADSRRTADAFQADNVRWRTEATRVKTESDNRFAGINLTGKRVVFLVDMSGSMDYVDDNTKAPEKWLGVRTAVAKIMRSLPDLEKFQLITFSDRTHFPLGRDGQWLDFDPKTSPDLVFKTLAAITPDGGTNMYNPMQAAFAMRAQGLDTVYLCSDGLPNLGEGVRPEEVATLTEQERGSRLGQVIRTKLKTDWNRDLPGQARVHIHTVGFFYESPDVGAFLWRWPARTTAASSACRNRSLVAAKKSFQNPPSEQMYTCFPWGFRKQIPGEGVLKWLLRSRFKTVVQAARLLLIAGEPPAPRGF